MPEPASPRPEGVEPAGPAGAIRGALAAAWAWLPARAFAIALAATALFWGRFLLPDLTLSPAAQVPTIDPFCRVGGAQLSCRAPYVPPRMVDAGAPAWVEIPDSYFFRSARARGHPAPSWNPYVGSGYPIAFDGHGAPTSPTRWFLARVPGDQGHDVLVFARFLLWTFGLVWAVGLGGAAAPLMAVVGVVATLAPYAASYLDIVFLDADLLGPWFLVILLALAARRLSPRAATAAAFGFGVAASAMGFVQSQVALCVTVGILALVAGPSTRWRSIWLGAAVAAAEALFAPTWLPLLRNLDQFVSSRDLLCIVQQSQGLSGFWRLLVQPLHPRSESATVTLAGAGLLAFAPRRWRFAVVALAVALAWLVLGLPSSACALPLLSGVRLVRHLVPHVQMLFVFSAALSAQSLSERLDQNGGWLALAALAALSAWVASGAEALTGGVVALAGLGGTLWLLLASARRGPGTLATAPTGALAAGLFAVAVLSYPLSSPALSMLRKGTAAGAEKLEALPLELDASTALGAVRDLARREDRRHYSPAGFLYPNWSAAVGIPDLLSLNALYPVGYHELNAALFGGWERDPQHALVPDRFVPPPPSAFLTTDFQRVLAVNRVSLLTFAAGAAVLPAGSGPYQASRCRFLARSPAQGAESWVCPDAGSIGFFPEVVRVVRSRAEAIAILKIASPSDIGRLALLGPELGLDGGGEGAGSEQAGVGTVLSVDRGDDELTYRLDVDRPGVFVVADTFFRGWRATANGAPLGIARANAAFKAVRVPRGRVDLVLRFSIDP